MQLFTSPTVYAEKKTPRSFSLHFNFPGAFEYQDVFFRDGCEATCVVHPSEHFDHLPPTLPQYICDKRLSRFNIWYSQPQPQFVILVAMAIRLECTLFTKDRHTLLNQRINLSFSLETCSWSAGALFVALFCTNAWTWAVLHILSGQTT